MDAILHAAMRIDPRSEIAGIRALKIRDCVRRVRGFWITPEYLARCLKVSASSASTLIESLVNLGILQESPASRADAWRYDVTEHGSRFMLASGAKPIKRQTADRLVHELLERVERINSDQSYLHTVEYVGVFGSYLSDSATINDIDIAYSLKRRDDNPELFMKRLAARVHEAKEAGRRFSSYSDELSWPEVELLRALKGRSTAISLHSTDDEILRRTPLRELYRRPEH
jgi:hypothetical protein